MRLSVSGGVVSTGVCGGRGDFGFEVVGFPFLDGGVLCSASCGVCVSQLIRFAGASGHVADFNTHNKLLTPKLLKQGYHYHKLRKAFSRFQIYPTELQLNKANSSDTEAPFLDFNLSITDGIVSSKIYDKQDDFNFEIVNFPFLDGDVPRSPSYGVYISQLIRFARVCSNVEDFNNRNLFLTAKLLKQGYRYHKIRKAFSKFYHRHLELIVKYNIGLKTLLQQGISELIFYGDLVYKFKRIVGKPNFSDQFKKIVKRYIRVAYNLDIMRQSACQVLNPITVYSYGFLFNCRTVG